MKRTVSLFSRLMALLLLFITSCKDTCDIGNNNSMFPQIEPYQLYNKDGTKYIGNGNIYICYTDENEDIIEMPYTRVVGGKFGYGIDNNEAPDLEPMIDYLPSTKIDAPSNYINEDKIINISNKQNSIHIEGGNAVIMEYRFYEENKPDTYKTLEARGELKNKDGLITEIYSAKTIYIYPTDSSVITGQIRYRQEVFVPEEKIIETADINIAYGIDIFFSTVTYGIFIAYAYEKTTIDIIKNESDYIHYNVNTFVGLRKNLLSQNNIATRWTLLDEHDRYRIR